MHKAVLMLLSIATSFVAQAQLPSDCIRVSETDSAIYVVNCNGKFGIYDDLTESYLIKPKFELIDSKNYFTEGYIRVRNKGKWGVYDIFGSEKIKIIYDSIGNFFEYPDAMLLVKADGKFGLLTEWGSELFKPKYDSIGMFGIYADDKALVKLNGLYGLISLEGYEFLPPQYDYIEAEGKYIEMCYRVRRNGFWGLVPIEGYNARPLTLSAKPIKASDLVNQGYGVYPEYDEIGPWGEIHQSFAVIRKNGKLGLIDNIPKVLVPCEFDKIEPFGKLDENCTVIYKDGKLGLLDLEGHVTLKPEYDSITKVDEFVFEVKKSGTATYVDPWGYEVDYIKKN